MENRFNMKKEELIDPVYEKQEGEKSTHYNILSQFFLHPTDNLKEFYDVLKNEYEQDLEKYEKNIEYYNFIESHRISSNQNTEIKKPIRPKKPPTYRTLQSWSADEFWFYRKECFLESVDKNIIRLCRAIIRDKLEYLFDKQTELYEEALDKLYDDLLNGRINWSQFSHGVNGLYKLYGLILLFQDKSTDKKEVDVKSENELKITPVKSREEMEAEYEAVIKQYLQETADG